jgi:hypothetical protein
MKWLPTLVSEVSLLVVDFDAVVEELLERRRVNDFILDLN